MLKHVNDAQDDTGTKEQLVKRMLPLRGEWKSSDTTILVGKLSQYAVIAMLNRRNLSTEGNRNDRKKRLLDLLQKKLTIAPIRRNPYTKNDVKNLIILWGANSGNYNSTSGPIAGSGQAMLMDGRMSESGTWNTSRSVPHDPTKYAVGHGKWEQGIITVNATKAVALNNEVFEHLVARVTTNPSIRILVAGTKENVYSLGTGIARPSGDSTWWYKIQLGIMQGLKKLQSAMKVELPAFTFENVVRGTKTVDEWIAFFQERVR